MFSINILLMICVMLSSFVAISFVTGQEVPSSPCPEVFKYSTQPNGNIYGRINVPYDGSSTLQLGVNASMKGYYTNNNQVKLKIKMTTSGEDLIQQRTNRLSYDIYFPFQNAIPKITRIEYNQMGYCTGPPEELIPGAPGVTSLWSGHNYYFQLPNGESSSAPSKPSLPVFPEKNMQPTASNERKPAVVIILPPNQKVECGVSKNVIVPLILGGNEISDGMFPWLAAMFTTNDNGYQFKCTTNLISNKHVITSARCVNFFQTQIVSKDDILLVFGKSNLKNWATSGALIRGASDIKTHPNADFNSGHGDVTVITLDTPVEFSSSISPICLWEGDNSIDDIVDKSGTVAGWGSDEAAQKSGRFSTSIAKSVDMPVVSENSCLFSNLSFFKLTSNHTFCAGKRDGITGTCMGDNGAGFMMRRNGKYYLRGLAFKVLDDKCDLNHFMVFCDAAKLTDWIKKSMTN